MAPGEQGKGGREVGGERMGCSVPWESGRGRAGGLSGVML